VKNIQCVGLVVFGCVVFLEPLDLNHHAQVFAEVRRFAPGGRSIPVSLRLGVTEGPLSAEKAVVECRGSVISHFLLEF
jgi:hypothetical protein